MGQRPCPIGVSALPDVDELEVWRPIPGHPGYEASSLGRVRSMPGLVWIARDERGYWRPRQGRVLKAWPVAHGYVAVGLAGGVKVGVHRLVAFAFHGQPPSDGHESAHRNGNAGDNRASNLRWRTRTENEQEKRDHGTYFRRARLLGERHHKAKLTEADIVSIRAVYTGQRGEIAAIAIQFGVARSTIGRIVRGRAWSHVEPRAASGPHRAAAH